MNQSRLYRPFLLTVLVITVIAILYYGSIFLVPLIFGAFFAMLFYPLVKKMKRNNIPAGVGIGVCVLVLIAIAGGLFLGVGIQTKTLAEDWPKIKKRLVKQEQKMEEYIINNFGVASEERIDRLKKRISRQKRNLSSWLQSFLGTFLGYVTQSLLVLVYMILFLLEHERIERFVVKLVDNNEEGTAGKIMENTRKVAYQYFIGRLSLIAILAVFYAIGFTISGVDYGIPIAIFVAVLSLIPYLGNIIGAFIAFLFAFTSSGGTGVLIGVLITMTLAQLLENYVLQPWIVGSSVSLNPLATFVSIIGFSILWGIAGTVLAIPIVGILKEVADRVDYLQPYAYLLGLEEE